MDNKKRTLIELVANNFIEIKKRNSKKTRNSKKSKISVSSVLISSEIKKIKNEINGKKSEEALEETAEEESEDREEIIVNGGYGTVSKHYGISPVVKYTDYNKLWSHLGAFRTYNTYENAESSNEIALKNGESSREMVSTETIEKAAKHFKYFVVGELMGEIGYVPPTGLGVSSKEWEKYRLMSKMSIYQPLLKLKSASA